MKIKSFVLGILILTSSYGAELSKEKIAHQNYLVSSLGILPPDMYVPIFPFLTSLDLVRLQKTCHFFSNCITDTHYKSALREDSPVIITDDDNFEEKLKYYQKIHIKNLMIKRGLPDSLTFQSFVSLLPLSLEVLSLKHQNIYNRQFSNLIFPETLKVLNLTIFSYNPRFVFLADKGCDLYDDLVMFLTNLPPLLENLKIKIKTQTVERLPKMIYAILQESHPLLKCQIDTSHKTVFSSLREAILKECPQEECLQAETILILSSLTIVSSLNPRPFTLRDLP